MNKNFKRFLFFFTTFAILFGIFIFRSAIFSGTLLLHGVPPYQISLLGEPATSCLSDPCKIRFTTGSKTLIAQKDGFTSLLITTEIPIFSTTELSLDFHPTPKLTRVEDYENSTQFTTNWLFDSQKSTLLNPSGNTIAIFPKNLTNPKIISNHNFSLILSDSQNYLIDHLTKQRTLISQPIPTFQTAAISPKGDYLAININNSLKLISLNPPSHTFDIIPHPSTASDSSFLWLNNGKLLFATNNSFETLTPNENSLTPIEFTDETSNYYLFSTYEPQSKNYELIADFPEINLPPADLATSNLEKTIYFHSGNQSYQISL